MSGSFWKRTVAGVLAACLWLGSCATLLCTAASDSGGVRAADASAWRQVPPSSLLAAILPDGTTKPMSPEEAAWLDHDTADATLASIRGALDVRLPTSVPRSMITTEPTDGGMTVRLSQYNDGERVWIPTGMTVNGETYILTVAGDAYEAFLPEAQLPTEDAVKVAVSYRTVISLDADACVLLGDVAHQAVQEARRRQAAYEQAVADYPAALEKYEAYLAAQRQYLLDRQAYLAYTKAYEQYEKDLAAYEQYLIDMETYRTQKAAYDAYLEEYAIWKEYTDTFDADAYDRQYQAYIQWKADMARVKRQLEIVNSCFLADPDAHRLYGTLRGDTVATVVSRQDELVSAGCSADDIAKADASTKALIALLNGYEPLKTEAEQYAYYVANYQSLKDHVKQLFMALDALYGNKIVPEILQMQGKLERYHQFVAQLYVLWCALDDGKLRDSLKPWTIAGKTAEQALVHKTFLLTDDQAATPLAAYPAPMDPVVPPSELNPPKQPAVVACPQEPVAVARPVEPAEVARPVLPTTVSRPAVPVAPTRSDELTALMGSDAAAITQGRALPREAYTYTATINQEWMIRLREERVLISFYNRDGSILLHSFSVTVGDEFSLPDSSFLQSHAPADTPQYTYVAKGWTDEEGAPVGTGSAQLTADEDRCFYAAYDEEIRTYTVTWVVGENRTDVSVPYGTLPVYPGADADRLIWSPAVDTVKGNAEYHGVYQSHYTVIWKLGDAEDEQLEEDYAAGTIPSFPGTVTKDPAGRYAYTFVTWNPTVSALTGDAVYEAEFAVTDLTPGLPVDAEVWVERPNGAYTVRGNGWFTDGSYELDLTVLADLAATEDRPLTLEADGVTLVLRPNDVKKLAELDEVRLTVTWQDDQFSFATTAQDALVADVRLPCESDLRAEMTADDGTSMMQLPHEGYVTFSVTSGTLYCVARGYAAQVESAANGGQVFADASVAEGGQRVTVRWSALPGYRLAKLSVTDADGTQYPVTLEGDTYTFVMPEQDVTITPQFELVLYTVSFYCNGELLSRQTYYYGQEVVLPSDPQGEEGRPFVRWSPEVTPVRGDAVYEAVFYTPSEEDAEWTRQYGWSIGQLVAIFLSVWLGLSAATLTLFFWLRNRKKRCSCKD